MTVWYGHVLKKITITVRKKYALQSCSNVNETFFLKTKTKTKILLSRPTTRPKQVSSKQSFFENQDRDFLVKTKSRVC